MGPDVENETRDVSHPTTVMIEQDQTIRSGELIELGRRRARIRTRERLRNNDPLVLTVSVPESRSEKTQAMFRVSSRVRRQRDDDGVHDYDVLFVTDERNLDRAGKLYAHFRARGIVEV